MQLVCHQMERPAAAPPSLSPDQLANSDALMWTMVVLVSTVATFLVLTLVHFERCGGDPQKRSLGNRLLSNNLTVILLQCWLRNALVILVRSSVTFPVKIQSY